MNLDLIELQRGSKATCVVVDNEECSKLKNVLSMKASVSNKFLFGGKAFKEKLEKFSKNGKLCYFLISNIDEVSDDLQNRFVGLVKDREFAGYNLPNNVIIVFSVNGKNALKKISPQLWNFCVNAI